jgi:hypothetical protein
MLQKKSGGMTNSNPGNIRFRELVGKYRMAYCTAPKGDKGALARYLCNYVRSKNGRFLKRDEDDPKLNRGDVYYEVGDEKAVGKCGQALREGTAILLRRNITHDGVEYDDEAVEAMIQESLAKQLY